MHDRHPSVGRLATRWAVGLSASWLLVFGPPPAVGRALLERRAHVLKSWGGYSERREIARVADEWWVARQRATGPTARTPAGEPVYAVVRVGSAPPSAELRERAEHAARVGHRTMLAWGLVIPVLLVLYTRSWVRRRRRLDELARHAPLAIDGPRHTARTTGATPRRTPTRDEV